MKSVHIYPNNYIVVVADRNSNDSCTGIIEVVEVEVVVVDNDSGIDIINGSSSSSSSSSSSNNSNSINSSSNSIGSIYTKTFKLTRATSKQILLLPVPT